MSVPIKGAQRMHNRMFGWHPPVQPGDQITCGCPGMSFCNAMGISCHGITFTVREVEGEVLVISGKGQYSWPRQAKMQDGVLHFAHAGGTRSLPIMSVGVWPVQAAEMPFLVVDMTGDGISEAELVGLLRAIGLLG